MEELEKDYKKISESINEIIPCDWDKVWVYAEILDDSAGITFYFTESNSEEYIYGHDIPERYRVSNSIYNHLLVELSDKFRELKKEYIKYDLGVWTTATLQLESSGKFSIEYGYDDVYSLGIDNVQRIAVWEYETFGFLPEDEEDKEAVLNYIKNKDDNYLQNTLQIKEGICYIFFIRNSFPLSKPINRHFTITQYLFNHAFNNRPIAARQSAADPVRNGEGSLVFLFI